MDAINGAYAAEADTNNTMSGYIGAVGNAMGAVNTSLFGVEENCSPNAGTQYSFQYDMASVHNTLSNIAAQEDDVTSYQTAISDWNSAIRSQLAPRFSNINKYSYGPSIP